MTRITASATIEHQIGASGRLSLKVTDWDIQLVAGPDGVVRVRDADGGDLPADLGVDRTADGLSIRQPSLLGLGFLPGAHDGGRRLTLDVPIHAAVTVQSASGDVASSGLHGEQHYRTASGDLHLDAAGGEVITETFSGDIHVGVEDSILLALKTVSGDVSVDGGQIERVRLTTTSGDVRLASDLGAGPHAIATVSGDVTLRSNRGLRITAVTVTGDLRSDLPHSSQGGPGRRSVVVGDGAAELQFRSVSGDLRVLDPAAPAPSAPPAPPLPHAPDAPPAPEAPDPAVAQDLAEARDAVEAARLEILRAVESATIDVAEAAEQLARLDGATDD